MNDALVYAQDKTKVEVRLEHVSKIYLDSKTHQNFYAVKDSNIVIKPGEFVTLLGPSGCGKTTTLRMIAGFESPDEGRIYIGNTPVNALTPNQRDTAMVFQSYALFPHYNVFDNVAYGLKLRKVKVLKTDENGNVIKDIDKEKIEQVKKVIKRLEKTLRHTHNEDDKKKVQKEIESQKDYLKVVEKTLVDSYTIRKFTKEEIHKKVMDMLELVELSGMESRQTNQLSGGQQQRVALARALVLNPSVLLFDEPLSNLDAKLRVSMRTEIRKIQQKVGITAIYVTHDQSEAMALSDRIIVMDKGYISQVGTPKDVYYTPENAFVAAFIGEVNFLYGKVKKSNKDEMVILIDGREIETKNLQNFKNGDEVQLVLRPESVTLADKGDLEVEVVVSTFMGSYQLYHVMHKGNLIKVTEYNPKGRRIFNVGEKAYLDFSDKDVHALKVSK